MKRSRLSILGVVLALTLFVPVASGHAGAGEGGAALSVHFDAYHHDEGGPDDDDHVTLGTADKEFFLQEGNGPATPSISQPMMTMIGSSSGAQKATILLP